MSDFEANEFWDEEANEDTAGTGAIGQSQVVDDGWYQGEVIEIIAKDEKWKIESKSHASSRKDVEEGTVFAFNLSRPRDGESPTQKKKRTAFYKATGLIQPGEAQSGKSKQVKLDMSVGKHFICKLQRKEYDGIEYNEPWDNIFSVNDPVARKRIKVNEAAIGQDDFDPPKQPSTEEQAKSVF